MQTYLVSYEGNASRFNGRTWEVNANSEREAVEDIYQQVMDDNYFPDDEGNIKDCSGHTIAEADDDSIEYDGGSFFAELIED